MILNCAIIDDDVKALEQVKKFVERTPTLSLIGAYTSAIEAVKHVKIGHIDILYLAIQMPELNGIEFAKIVPQSCRIVFITAFKQYAFDGFRVNAVDYLLKPITYADFQKSYKKVRGTFADYTSADPIARDRFIIVKTEYRTMRINLDDILYIESVKDYVKLHLADGRKISTFSNLKRIEERLPRQQFKRTHRSFIANMTKFDFIDRMRIHYGDGSIPVSDSYKNTIQHFVDEHTI